MKLEPSVPEKLLFLFQPMRYKVAYGGRGGGKSWSFARALLTLATIYPLRILCAREVQRSIRDSVHRLLKDQIIALGLLSHFEIYDQSIRGTNGSEFAFIGLSALTETSIKSYEGFDICWVEEGQAISEGSWEILTPTIRKPNSEIWVSFNPVLDTDPTYKRFVTNPPSDCICIKINFYDNPWFEPGGVLDRERLDCLRTNPKNYPNIWLGECKPAVEGAIYYDEVQALLNSRPPRYTRIPYDPLLKAHIVLDLGHSDFMSVSVVQKHMGEIRIILYIEDHHRDLAQYSARLKENQWNWGKVWLPYADGFSKGSSGQKSAEMIMKSLGWDVAQKEDVSNLGLEAGIGAVRLTFPRIVINNIEEMGGPKLLEHLKRYHRNVNITKGTVGAPAHDEHSHGADNFRYICINEGSMRNDLDRVTTFENVVSYSKPLDAEAGY